MAGSGLSRSVLPASANRAHAPATARYVVFGERPVLVEDLDQVSKVAVTSDAAMGRGAVQQGATNIELALDEALLAFDPDQIKRLVLLSDGNATAPNGVKIIKEYYFGPTESVSSIGYDNDVGRFMVTTSSTAKDGRLYYFDSVTDPTPSAQ